MPQRYLSAVVWYTCKYQPGGSEFGFRVVYATLLSHWWQAIWGEMRFFKKRSRAEGQGLKDQRIPVLDRWKM